MSDWKFIIGGGLMLAAAIVFSAGLLWHDLRVSPPAQIQNSSIPSVSGTMRTPPSPEELHALEGLAYQTGAVQRYVGQVQAVAGDQITFSYLAVDPATARPTGTTTLTATVDSSTEIYKIGDRKSDAEFQKEMDEFLSLMQYASTSDKIYVAPERFGHIELTLSDITPGMYVLVQPVAPLQGSNLRALRIQVNASGR